MNLNFVKLNEDHNCTGPRLTVLILIYILCLPLLQLVTIFSQSTWVCCHKVSNVSFEEFPANYTSGGP